MKNKTIWHSVQNTFYVAFLGLFLASNVSCAHRVAGEPIDPRDLAEKTENLDAKVAYLGLKAYQNAQQQGLVKKPYLVIIDYSKPSDEKRLWVFDLRQERLLYELHVTHGVNTGERMATRFSNIYGSRQSSLGTFVTENVYYGKFGYSLRLEGLDPGINDNAKIRGIVIHGAPYASESFLTRTGQLGLSWGCPAIDDDLNAEVITLIQEGSVIFSYYPHEMWLASL